MRRNPIKEGDQKKILVRESSEKFENSGSLKQGGEEKGEDPSYIISDASSFIKSVGCGVIHSTATPETKRRPMATLETKRCPTAIPKSLQWPGSKASKNQGLAGQCAVRGGAFGFLTTFRNPWSCQNSKVTLS